MIVSNCSIISPDNFIATSTLSNPESAASIINHTYIFPISIELFLSWSSIFNSADTPLDTYWCSHTGQCVLKPKYLFFPINMVLLRNIIIYFNDTTILTVTQIKNPEFLFSTASQKPFEEQPSIPFFQLFTWLLSFYSITAIPT